ncbi:MAG: LamG-like jellyroll fold domain-containing protein [Thermoguttaceae bacterium]|jgi:hypothetical protein|nr:LamG-like jellyroll fold domain-containing protein [Thermoguttaceae bacterium]
MKTITIAGICFALLLSQPLAAAEHHWPLDSPTDASIAVRGTATVADGIRESSLLLDGESLVEVADSAGLAAGEQGFTLAIWVNPYALDRGQQMIAAKNRYSLGEREWGVMIDRDGEIRLYVRQDDWQTVEAEEPPELGHWHHVGVVMRPDRAELWVNGRRAGQIALTRPIVSTGAPLTFGGVNDNGRIWQTLFGALDEARLLPKPLSADEMAALYTPVAATHEVPKLPEPFELWAGAELPASDDIPVVEGVTFSVIKQREPEVDGYNWLHGAALCWHKGKLYASFGHNKGSENTETEEARGRVSPDGGNTWGEVFTMDPGEENLAVSHGVFLSHDGKLWAFMGAFYNHFQRTHTRAYLLDEATGQWQPQGAVVGEGFWPMQEPLKMDDGNWIMSGCRVGRGYDLEHLPAVAISRGEDLTQWDMVVICAAPGVSRVWGESTVIVDGARILNVSRWGGRAYALAATSDDYGRTWTPSGPSNLPMAASKPYTGTLSTGQHYLVCTTTADSGNRRSPLTIAVTRPGEPVFSAVYRIRDAVHDGPGESHPAARLSYPYAVEHEGKLYVVYSNCGGRGANRNSAEMAIIPISALATP